MFPTAYRGTEIGRDVSTSLDMTNAFQRERSPLQASHFTFMFFVNANFADTQDRHLLAEPLEIFGELRVRMRVRRGRKRNSFLDCEFDDAIGRIKLVHRFAPACGRKFDGKIARSNEIESLIDDLANFGVWPMTMNLN